MQSTIPNTGVRQGAFFSRRVARIFLQIAGGQEGIRIKFLARNF